MGASQLAALRPRSRLSQTPWNGVEVSQVTSFDRDEADAVSRSDGGAEPLERDLRTIAVQNGVILMLATFFLGGAAGWWVTAGDRSLTERMIGLAAALLLLAWAALVYHRSGGLMAHS